ncbi:MAG: hypothetical protein QNJ40_24985 [Xanthomonadales bacterium]|nr:hypothetical protein [Xanthomonadales bacterium]
MFCRILFITILSILPASALLAQDLALIEDLFRDEVDLTSTGQSFGWAVEIDGDWAAVSAPFVNSQDGEVYLFRFSQSPAPQWQFVKQLERPPESARRFGLSVTIEGDLMVVGANFIGAHVYQRDTGGLDNWGFVESLAVDDTATRRDQDTDLAVALSGDTLVVGAPNTDYIPLGGSEGNQVGSVFIYQRQGNSFNLEQTLEAPLADQIALARFGQRVDIDGDTLAIGSSAFNVQEFTSAGRAWVYRNVAGNWTLQQTLNTSSPGNNTAFGEDVAVSGDRVAVGATGGAGDLTPGVSNDGSVYVFRRDIGGADQWGLELELVPSQPQFINDFGRSVSLADDLLWAGADDAAYLFRDNGGLWPEVDRNPAPVYMGDANVREFGFSAALGVRNGGTQVLGLIGDQTAENFSNTRVGAAFFYFYDDGIFADSFED